MYYFVPEDAESGKQLNCFIVRRPIESITLGMIREDFPLPGDYHFRFHYAYQSSNCKVWLDLPSEDNKVPLIEGEIRVKATRKNWLVTGEAHHGRKPDKQEVRKLDLIIYHSDAIRRNSNDGASIGQAVGSMLNKGFSKMTNMFGGVANSVQSQVNSTYDQPPAMSGNYISGGAPGG